METQRPLTAVARRADAVLLVIDIQERLAAVMRRRHHVLAETIFLVEVASALGIPVIGTRQYPKGLGGFEPEIEIALEAQAGVSKQPLVVDKLAFDCFADEGFSAALGEVGRRQLVIAGMETHICVAQTALHAIRLGLECVVVEDACCSRADGAHASALDRMRAAGVVVSPSESVAYEFASVAGTDEFRTLLAAVKRRDARLQDGAKAR